MRNHYEASLQRRMTLQFIQSNEVQISLNRDILEDDGMGGTRVTGSQVLPAQQVHIANNQASNDPNQAAELGDITREEHLIVGSINLDIQEGDYFEWRGSQFDVTHVPLRANDYETRAIAVREGGHTAQ